MAPKGNKGKKSKGQPQPHHPGNRKNQHNGGKRAYLKTIAEDTLQRLSIDEEVLKAVADTVTYLPSQLPVNLVQANSKSKQDADSHFEKSASDVSTEESFTPFDNTKPFQVLRMSTLDACRQLLKDGLSPCALNFASAKNPGGGFLRGSSAQEESLCRSSGLYYCIKDSNVYEMNRKDNNRCLYAHSVIYSPDVPVIKDDDGKLLEEPYKTSFLTSPAVNTGVAKKKGVKVDEIESTLKTRIDAILSVAAFHKERVLVLGAWGCGVFGNDSAGVAQMFASALRKKYKTQFSHVVFAIVGNETADEFEKALS